MTRTLIALFALLLAPVGGANTLVGGTAALVGKTLITVHDAYFYRAVQRFRDGEADVLGIETGDELRRTVQKIIFEEMVVAELKSFKFEGGSRAEAENLVRSRRAKTKPGVWNTLLARYGRTEGAVVDTVWRSLQVERFLQKKVETLTPVITTAEVERYYAQNKGRLQGGDYEALKPKIVLLLKKERMQKGLEEWVRFLRDRYGVINFLAAG